MIVIDRSQAPAAHSIDFQAFPAYETARLNNGVTVYFLRYGVQPVAEITLAFRSGQWSEDVLGSAFFSAKMLSEGTQNYTALELAEKLDYYGAFLSANAGSEITEVTLSSLSRFIPQTLELMREMVTLPSFPQAEFDLQKQRVLQSLKIEEQKTAWQANRHFFKFIYGDKHPYGKHLGIAELEKLQLEDLKRNYASQYRFADAFIVCAGFFEPTEILGLLNDAFGGISDKPAARPANEPKLVTSEPQECYFPMPNKVQSTIRLGYPSILRSHPNYHKYRLVNLILGGYFGSRLMQNIREDKGYTYGIHSALTARKHAGAWYVSADLANEYVRPAIDEIKNEMKALREELVTKDELETAKNYMLGKKFSGLDTPFAIAEKLKYFVANELPVTDMRVAYDQITAITSTELQNLAKELLVPDNLITVVCGKENDTI